MEPFRIIVVPKELWLDVNNFIFESLTYEDLRDIYSCPTTLIDDFKQIPEFNNRVRVINERRNHEIDLKNIRDREIQSIIVSKKIDCNSKYSRPNTPIFNQSTTPSIPKPENFKLPDIHISESKPPLNKTHRFFDKFIKKQNI